ncbi:glycosyl hydrolase family 28 protein [uncultured Bacteroides sp.]|uniref:glycoside hydrolase family 28 protein n=1 Tax=uncultured Bacteroides sp. TaxID=162156 RepID=UPI0025DAEF32|nr:glycosyl hydrolase family 28 protein [uncultured Bacteroides sp.]
MKLIKILLLTVIPFIHTYGADHNITFFGAKTDGITVSTKAIQKAIDESSKDGGRVIIPAGDFITGTLFLKDNTTLVLEKNARLLGSKELSDYPKTTVEFRFFGDTWVYQSLIIAHNVNNITIEGEGTIDGQGAAFPVTTKVKPDRYRNRPYLLWIADCKNVTVKNIELRSSAMWLQSYIRCEKLRIDGIRVFNHANKNNDLMDIDGCKDVVITNIVGDADDDGITFKSTTDRISENIVVSNCILSSHCNAIKFGTESTAGFRNVVITNCIIRKSAAKDAKTGFPEGICGIALEIVDGGIMENINISNIVVDGPRVPLFVRLGNRARKHYNEAPQPPIGSISNINISGITAYASSPIGCSITGIFKGKIKGISLSNCRFACLGGISENMDNVIMKELEELYPESTMFGLLPSYGLYVRHVNDINLDNIVFELKQEDSRPAIVCDDVTGGNIRNITTIGAKKKAEIRILDNSVIELK